MKRFITSAGLVALGTVGLHAQYAPGLTRLEASKPWSVSAALRGFYDDNYNTAPSHPSGPGIPRAADSFGFEISPSVALNLPMEQTLVQLGYIYSFRWYDGRPENKDDQAHEFTGKVEHRFSERYKLTLDESFVYAQEPEIVEPDVIGTPTLRRTQSDVLRNRAALNFIGQLTELWGVGVGYQNTWYDYQQSGDFSRSALLDRFEHLIRLDGRYQLDKNTVALLGYQYGIFDYTSGAAITADPFTGETVFRGTDRDNTSHYFYVGGERTFTSALSAQARVGAQYTDYDKLDESDWSPYADLSATYTYLPGSHLQVGFRHIRNATDIAGIGDQITLDAETSALYASVNHRITSRLTGSLLGQLQNSSFNHGQFDGDVDNLYLVGMNLEYKFNNYWATEAGYNFDRLDSDLQDRSFSRNRVYVGVRASY